MKNYLSLLLLALGLSVQVSGFAANNESLKINFATDASYPPFEYVTSDGNIEGFDISMAKALCQQMAATCTFANQPWDSLIPSLKLGKYDALISAMGITEKRAKQVTFSNPYYEPAASFVAAKSENLDLSKAGMKGKVVGSQIGTTLVNYIRKTYGKEVKVKTYLSQQSAFLDLKAGRVDAVFGDTPLILEWVKQQGKDSAYTVVGKPIRDQAVFGIGFGVAVNKGNKDLATKFNDALAAIKENGEYQKVYQQYGIPLPDAKTVTKP